MLLGLVPEDVVGQIVLIANGKHLWRSQVPLHLQIAIWSIPNVPKLTIVIARIATLKVELGKDLQNAPKPNFVVC